MIDFDQLIDDIKACNTKLYQPRDDDEEVWQAPLDLIEQRALFLENLSSIIPTLNPQQIKIVGQLYESIEATDQHYLGQVEAERVTTRNALRAIKKAEKKALPAYKAHL